VTIDLPGAEPVPWFSPQEQAGLDELWRIYDTHFDAIWSQTWEVTQKRGGLAPTSRGASDGDMEAQRRHTRDVMQRGVGGDWRPFEESVRRRARIYAGLGVTFAGWYPMGGALVEVVMPHLTRELAGKPERLQAAQRALRQFVDKSVGLLGDEFVAAKEAALKQSDSDLAATLDGIGEAIIATDSEARVTRMNPVAEQLTGWRMNEARQQPITNVLHLAAFSTHEPWHKPVASVLMLGVVVRIPEGTVMQARDGSEVSIAGTLAPIRDAAGAIRGIVMVLHDIGEAIRAKHELLDRQQRIEATAGALYESEKQLRALAARLQLVSEDERTRIARQIHDELGSQLTAIRMDLGWLSKRMAAAGQEKVILERLAAMDSLVDATITTVRQLATELRPGVLDDLGLVAALEWQAREFTTRSGIEVQVVGPGDELQVSSACSTALFRCFQEILTNARRHAHATQVVAHLLADEQALVLDVEDNGCGITAQQAAGSTSLGLIGMRERAALLGGTLRIERGSGGGTHVVIRISDCSVQHGGPHR